MCLQDGVLRQPSIRVLAHPGSLHPITGTYLLHRWRSAFWLEALLMAPFALFCLLAPPIDMRGPMAGVSMFDGVRGDVCQLLDLI
jgi:hypothetical protein